MWPDIDTEIDYLNFTEISDLAVDIIRDTPVGIEIPHETMTVYHRDLR